MDRDGSKIESVAPTEGATKDAGEPLPHRPCQERRGMQGGPHLALCKIIALLIGAHQQVTSSTIGGLALGGTAGRCMDIDLLHVDLAHQNLARVHIPETALHQEAESTQSHAFNVRGASHYSSAPPVSFANAMGTDIRCWADVSLHITLSLQREYQFQLLKSRVWL